MNGQTTTTVPSITCGHCHQTHHSVNAVRVCYGLQGMSIHELPGFTESLKRNGMAAFAAEQAPTQPVRPAAVAENPATEKQVAFIARLRAERGLPELAFAGSKKQASSEIERLLALPKAVAKTAVPERTITEGIWKASNADGTDDVYKVYRTVHGANILAVKRLSQRADKKGSFKYLGSAARFLPRAAVKMTLDEAQAFGKLYGFCVRCGRTLTDENSIAAGIGPVCSGKAAEGFWG